MIIYIIKDAICHYEHLTTFFKRTEQTRISINFQNSNFMKEQVQYLGYEVSASGIQIDTSLISALDRLQIRKRNDVKKY